jgi:hypothetical protein
MKKVVLAALLVGFSINVSAEIILKENISPAQLKEGLLKKYQGKINGIEQLSRATNDSLGLAGATAVRQKIDAAANRLIGMGSVDTTQVESDIENALFSTLTSIFKQSISLAAKTYVHEASDHLFAISPWNKKIVWNDAQTHVLMLTWIPAAYKKTYEDKLNSGEDMKIAWDAWVTAVPEVKEFAQNYVRTNPNGFNLTDRIEQFLGLIPSKPPYAVTQNKLFVEMWVRPEDLFRPCLDAEIGDTECMIDPHESDLDKLPVGYRDMSKLIPMTPQHKAWFEKEKKGKYEGQWAMPWTRFGYTYDWGSTKKSTGKRAAQGASEYLIKNGSIVKIQSIIPTDEYPNAPTPRSGYTYRD